MPKDETPRNPYCNIEIGNLDRPKDKGAMERFSTDIIKANNNPYWNQHVLMEIKRIDDKINLEVWDDDKNHFLGRVLLNCGQILESLESNGRISGWYSLEKHPKHKNKYVDGSLYLDITSDQYVCFTLKLIVFIDQGFPFRTKY